MYELINKAEHSLTDDHLKEAIGYYKEAGSELSSLLQSMKCDKGVDHEITKSIELLKASISQTMFELSNFAKQQNGSSAPKELVNGSILQPRKLLEDSSTFATIEQDLNKLSLENDVVLNMITTKLQKNLLEVMSTSDETGKKSTASNSVEERRLMLVQHIEQFKKELNWYEKKKFSQYNLDLVTLTKENAKLRHQVEKQRDRWNNLVESARQRRGN